MGNKIGTDGPGTALPFGPLARPSASLWQPIETAPKVRADGRPQWLLLHGDGTGFMQCTFVGYWEHGDDSWVEVYDSRKSRPTHWMFLPEPPAEQSGGPTGQAAQAAVSSNPASTPIDSSQGGV